MTTKNDKIGEEENPFHGVEKRDLYTLVNLSTVQDLVELCEFMEDPVLAEMIDLAIKCLAQPNLKPETAEHLLVKFQAASMKFGMLAVTYTTLKKGSAGTDSNYKKNIYYTASEQCDKIASSLKYIVRRNSGY